MDTLNEEDESQDSLVGRIYSRLTEDDYERALRTLDTVDASVSILESQVFAEGSEEAVENND
jgi:hypothetical protein